MTGSLMGLYLQHNHVFYVTASWLNGSWGDLTGLLRALQATQKRVAVRQSALPPLLRDIALSYVCLAEVLHSRTRATYPCSWYHLACALQAWWGPFFPFS